MHAASRWFCMFAIAGVAIPACPAVYAAAEVVHEALEELVVTARRRQENVQDVPESINVLAADTIDAAGIRSLNDVTRLVPSFTIAEAQNPGVAIINIRGIGQLRNGEPPIAFVVDGVQQASPTNITQELFDIERIEVLKGPQGSLYGRNAVGGAVNITTRIPGNELAGYLEGSYGEGDDGQLRFAASGPLVEDSLLFRVSGSYQDRNGQIYSPNIDDDVDYDRIVGARSQLIFRTAERFSGTLSFSAQDQNSGATWFAIGEPNEHNGPTGNILGIGDRDLRDASLKLAYEMSGATLTSITAYSKAESYLYEDLDVTALDLLAAAQTLDFEAVSQELRLAESDNAARLQWLVGLYWLQTDRDFDTTLFLQPGLTGLPAPVPLPPAQTTDDNEAYASFAQGTYSFNDFWALTLGLRYDVDERQQTDRNPPSPAAPREFSEKFSSLQPKVSLAYKASERLLYYLTAGKGFRSGGFNATDLITRVYDKEELWSYELGFKSETADRRYRLNGAVFYTDISDRQIFGIDVSVGATQFIANPIPKSHVLGAELEFAARPIDSLQLALGLGVQDSEIDEYDRSVFGSTLANGDYEGNELEQLASFSVNGSVQHSFALSANSSWSTRIDVSGWGGFYWDISNDGRRDPVWLTDVNLIYTRGPLAVTAFAKNLFNERYDMEWFASPFSGLPYNIAGISRPRQYGAKIRWSF